MLGKSLLLLGILICPAVRADVIVNTSLNLLGLQILPGVGTAQVQSGVSTSAFAQVQDSLGNSPFSFDSETDVLASAVADTPMPSPLGTAMAAAAPDLTAMASSTVGIFGIDAAVLASVGPFGAIFGTFTINDNDPGTNPVNVQFIATLSALQSLMTDAQGLSADSEVTFAFDLPGTADGHVLFYDNPLSIGPGSSLNQSANPVLSATQSLLTNTQYSFYLEVDAESFGVNTTTPEPMTGALLAIGLSLLFAYRHAGPKLWRRG